MKIKISEIKVGDNRREIDEPNVASLAKSIKEIGLINPITVTKDYQLIAGAHRMEACKRLGMEEVECNVVGISGLKAELAEIDENLVRHSLNAIDEGDQMRRRQEIYEALYPETKASYNGGGFKGNQHKKEVTDTVSLTTPKSFAEDTAEKMGITPRTVQRKIQVSRDLIPEVKAIIKEHGISEKNSLKLARIKEPEKQKEVAEKLANHEIKTVDEAIKKPEPIPAPQPSKEPEKVLTTLDLIKTLRNLDGTPEYTVDMLIEEIQSNSEDFYHSIKNTLTLRSTLLSNAENKKKIISALNEIQSQINKLKEIIK